VTGPQTARGNNIVAQQSEMKRVRKNSFDNLASDHFVIVKGAFGRAERVRRPETLARKRHMVITISDPLVVSGVARNIYPPIQVGARENLPLSHLNSDQVESGAGR
jgi:hypothetical protein